MVSKSKKEIADLIAGEVLNLFMPAFLSTKYLDDKHRFTPPANFWADTYIIGFAFRFADLLLTIDFDGEAMMPEEKEEIILLYTPQICGKVWQQVIQTVNQLGTERDKDLEFTKGIREAELAYGTISGRLNPNDPDPLLQEARELAKNMRRNEGLDDASVISDSIIEDSIGGAIMVLTITTHIKANYLS